MDKKISFLRRKLNAQGMIEFALVLPLLLLLIYGIIEAGRLLFIYSTVLTSSREAARYGAAAGDITPTIRTARYKDCAGIRAAARRIGGLAGVEDSNISIVYDRGPGTSTIAHCNTTFTITGGSGTFVTRGDRVVVQVGATYQPLVSGITRFSSFPITSVTRRTILKDVELGGTPVPPPIPKVYFTTSSQEHSEDAGEVTIQVELNAASSKAVTIPYTISGTAAEGPDFSITPSPVFISPGDVSVEIVIQINDDDMDEDDENIVVSMGVPTNADLDTPNVHTVTVTDNDEPPFVSFTASNQALEEDQDIFINLELSAASSFDITVYYSVTGSASQGADPDYSITSSPITIPAGSTSVTIVASVIDDAMDEYDETIIVTLDDFVKGQRGSPDVHTATIIDNDLPPYVSFTWADQSAEESAGSMIVQLELSAISGRDITVPFSVSGDAELDSDYSISASPVSIPAGSETAEITITILDDGDPTEEDEKVILTILSPTNAMIGTPDVHTATITNTFETPTVSFSASKQVVDENAEIKKITIQVRLSHATYQNVTVPFSVGGTAEEVKDYLISDSPVVIPAGGARVNIVITITDDFLDELDETIVVTMGTPTHAIKGSPNTHIVTITDNDEAPTGFFALESQTVLETVGTQPIYIQLTAPSSLDISIPFTFSGTAEQGVDYSIPGSPIVIPAGSVSGEIAFTVIDDNLIEADEQVTFVLGTPTNATLGSPASHTVMIGDDDPICPTPTSNPYFGSTYEKDFLIWPLQSSNPLILFKLMSVTLSWPVAAENVVTDMTFGTSIYSGIGNPPYLEVYSSVGLWAGTFNTQDLVIIFDKNRKLVPGEVYQVTATFENCTPISATIPSD